MLQATQRGMECGLMGIKKLDKIKNLGVRDQTRAVDVGYTVKKLKLKFAGHVARERGQKWDGD